MSEDGRIFSEKEIGLVLKRAAEIQGKQPRTTGYGLSMEELQQLAAESGLDPELVVAAALELDSDDAAEGTNWWGGPLTLTLVRVVEGPLSDDTWEEMLAVLRRQYKETGITEQRGSTRQWSFSARDQRKGHLIATCKGGRTELEFFWANPTLAIPFAVIPLVLSLISLPIIMEESGLVGGMAFLAWLGIVTVLWTAAGTGVGLIGGRSRKETRQIADQIAGIAKRRSTPAGSNTERHTKETDSAREALSEPSRGAYIQIPDDEFSASPRSPRERKRGR
jgi:hypothetical protein